jgi:hypothetical protein
MESGPQALVARERAPPELVLKRKGRPPTARGADRNLGPSVSGCREV